MNPYIIITIGAILVVIGIILFNMGKSLQNKNQKKSGTFTLVGFILLTAGLILLLTAIRVLFTMKVPVKRADKDKFIWICLHI